MWSPKTAPGPAVQQVIACLLRTEHSVCAALLAIRLLPQQNLSQPGNRQCALVQGAVVEVGQREVLASGCFIGAAQAPPFAGTHIISRQLGRTKLGPL